MDDKNYHPLKTKIIIQKLNAMKKDNEEPGVQAGFVAMFLLATEPQKQVQEEAFSKVEEILGKLIDEIFRYLNLRRFINQHWFSGFMLFKN